MAISMNLEPWERKPSTGFLDGRYSSGTSGAYSYSGDVVHRGLITITDSLSRFGTRTNVKPLYVNFGDSAAGDSLGRLTGTYINSGSGCTIGQTEIKNGALLGSHKFNITVMGTAGITLDPSITFPDNTKEIYQYRERRYDWDFANPRVQCKGYYMSVSGSPNTATFTIIIDGRTYSFTNDGTPGSISNKTVVAAALAVSINADSLCKCTAVANDGTFDLNLTKKTPADVFDVTYSANIFQNFNNKTDRFWPQSYAYDVYVATKSATLGSTVAENLTGVTPSYLPNQTPFTWLNQEYVFKNSSAAGVQDGYLFVYQNGVCLNPTCSVVTYKSGDTPIERPYLNQFANGPYGYWQNGLDMYLGYQCWDDEVLGIYFGDASTQAACNYLVRQPQTAWAAGSVSFVPIASFVPVTGAHVYLRTSRDSFTYLFQIRSN